MADFRWSDIYRITKAVSRDVPKNEDEILSWISTYHFSAIAFRDVHKRSKRRYDWRPRDPLGRTIYETLLAMIASYVAVLSTYPQFEIEKALELLRYASGAPIIEEADDG